MQTEFSSVSMTSILTTITHGQAEKRDFFSEWKSPPPYFEKHLEIKTPNSGTFVLYTE